MEQESLEGVSMTTYRTLRKIGGSITIALPMDFVNLNQFRKGQRVQITFLNNTLTISPLKKASEE